MVVSISYRIDYIDKYGQQTQMPESEVKIADLDLDTKIVKVKHLFARCMSEARTRLPEGGRFGTHYHLMVVDYALDPEKRTWDVIEEELASKDVLVIKMIQEDAKKCVTVLTEN